MTDKEIIKAFEVDKDYPDNDITRSCEKTVLLKKAYLLMCRQQAEIEKIRSADPMDFCGVLCDFSEELINKAKAEAIKEFAERLKEIIQFSIDVWGDFELYAVIKDIDGLVKEMAGADNG